MVFISVDIYSFELFGKDTKYETNRKGGDVSPTDLADEHRLLCLV